LETVIGAKLHSTHVTELFMSMLGTGRSASCIMDCLKTMTRASKRGVVANQKCNLLIELCIKGLLEK